MALDEEEYLPFDAKEVLKYKGEGFDHRVEILHPQTGQVLRYQPYSMTVTKDGTGAIVKVYERGGKKYWENGREASSEDLEATFGATHPIVHKKEQKLSDALSSELAKKSEKPRVSAA